MSTRVRFGVKMRELEVEANKELTRAEVDEFIASQTRFKSLQDLLDAAIHARYLRLMGGRPM